MSSNTPIRKIAPLVGLLCLLIVVDILILKDWLDPEPEPTAVNVIDKIDEQKSPSRTKVKYGEEAPDFYITDVENNVLSKKRLLSKPVLFHFFLPDFTAHWSVLNYTNGLAIKNEGAMEFIIVAPEEVKSVPGWETLTAWEEMHLVIDSTSKMKELFGPNSRLGATIILDREGKIAFASNGLVTKNNLKQLVYKYSLLRVAADE